MPFLSHSNANDMNHQSFHPHPISSLSLPTTICVSPLTRQNPKLQNMHFPAPNPTDRPWNKQADRLTMYCAPHPLHPPCHTKDSNSSYMCNRHGSVFPATLSRSSFRVLVSQECRRPILRRYHFSRVYVLFRASAGQSIPSPSRSTRRIVVNFEPY